MPFACVGSSSDASMEVFDEGRIAERIEAACRCSSRIEHDECTAFQGGYQEANLLPAVRAGRIRFVSAEWDECIAQTRRCDRYRPACARALVGALEVGDHCMSSEECVPSAYCANIPESGRTVCDFFGMCELRPRSGERCTAFRSCTAGHACLREGSGTSVCGPPVGRGERCSPYEVSGEWSCADDLVCVPGEDGSGLCGDPGGSGSPCMLVEPGRGEVPASSACARGLVCSPVSGVCRDVEFGTVGEVGDPCVTDSDCKYMLTCRDGRCWQRLPNGSTCESHADCFAACIESECGPRFEPCLTQDTIDHD